jgi:DNA topoisomerase-1
LKLVIVESPAKAKTIGKFLGKDYHVEASYGHVRDLPTSAAETPKEIKDQPWADLAVDVDNDFTAYYVVQKDSKKQIAELRKLLKDSDEVVLATDEDREGEAISWHLLEILKPKVPVRRIVFHEITQEAIDHAVANPRNVNDGLVRAQEGRRILDRLFGYRLSPVLWRKVRPGLSAGRVQSVALRLVVEREEARRAFKRSTYWDVEAALSAEGKQFEATLVSVDGKRLASGKDFDADTGALKSEDVAWIRDEAEAEATRKALEENLPWVVSRVEQKEATQRPYPPFITSTLQQAASSLLGFNPSHTMRVAQRLYEGIDLGGGEREGLITYMRTDSVTLSDRALGEAASLIKGTYGEEYHQPRRFKTKAKGAQEAHEAIRPTDLKRRPEQVAKFLDADQQKLYRIIWNRTIASQMADAKLLKTTVEFTARTDRGEGVLRANGSVVTFPGFLKVADSAQQDTLLPEVKEGQQVARDATAGGLALEGCKAVKHETKPPARYTEASLIKKLEDEGIGRPSTYAPTVGVIQGRNYVERQGKNLVPTYLGIAVVRLLRQYFPEYIDFDFTARMEGALDDIADGDRDWVDFLRAFYRGNGDFGPGLENEIKNKLEEIEFPAIPVGEDENGTPIVVRLGRKAVAPFVQRGEGGEGNTASVPLDLPYDELTAEKALDLIAERAKGNEPIGDDPETGEPIFALVGPYGPYVQRGAVTEENKKPKRTGLPKGTPIESVTMEMALGYLSLPRKLGDHPESGKSVRAGTGRFGPYIVHDGDFRSLPKDENVLTVSFEKAMELLAQPKRTRGQKTVLKKLGKHPESEVELVVYDGRYGPYVSDGKLNASLPKDSDVEAFTVEQAVPLLAEAAEKKPGRKRKAAPKKKAAAKKKPAAKKKAAAKKKPAAKKKAAAKKKSASDD